MEVELLCPWYRGFKGSILHSGNDVRGHRIYASSGVVKVVKPTTLVITELPIGLWTLVYKEDTLEQMLAKGLIKGYSDRSCLDNVKLKIYLNEENRKSDDQLIKDFKLTSKLCTDEMVLFDEKDIIIEFHTRKEILVRFFKVRLDYYGRRYEKLLNDYQRELTFLAAKIRFVKAESEGKINVKNVEKGRNALHEELRQEGYPCDESTTGFDYLLRVSDHLSLSLTNKRIQDLRNKREQIRQHLMDLRNTTSEDLWLCDLEALEKALPPGDGL
ncbi:unnamed protein product [Cuscuta campestris]|uniref:DNA topoisomerase (ATP-hydrolyzing) n=1 Tax=Cuscuta campestris TaxID=132261 RepID=A0A484NLA9_9ASTE|nr:unnamed protein product [Cuscuta campestris]